MNNLSIKYKIKCATLIIFAVILMILSAVNILAASYVSYSLESNGSCDNNRLFIVDVYATGSDIISAVDISIKYDEEYVKYRSVSKANTSFEIDNKESKNEVRTIFLCSSGYKIDSKSKLLSYTFKSIKSGDTFINISVSDPVSNESKTIPIGDVNGCKITINGKTITSKTITLSTNNDNNDNTNDSNNILTNSKNNTVSSKSSDAENKNQLIIESEASSSVDDETYNLVDKNDDSFKPYFIGALVAVGVIALLFVVYRLGAARKDKKE